MNKTLEKFAREKLREYLNVIPIGELNDLKKKFNSDNLSISIEKLTEKIPSKELDRLLTRLEKMILSFRKEIDQGMMDWPIGVLMDCIYTNVEKDLPWQDRYKPIIDYVDKFFLCHPKKYTVVSLENVQYSIRRWLSYLDAYNDNFPDKESAEGIKKWLIRMPEQIEEYLKYLYVDRNYFINKVKKNKDV